MCNRRYPKALEYKASSLHQHLTIIGAKIVSVENHIYLAQLTKRVKDPALVLIPRVSLSHPLRRILPTDASIKNL